ncbi:MAG: DUF1015 family protein [Actinomycetaceae bacterium]|nr:DUF1015 family protein [Actinomycetaceae bacterium]MDY5854906.1 DUF1015 family protein [Arcanobacterium sp.]
MVSIIPFAAWRPAEREAATFACPPYDVLTRAEAAALAPTHRFLSVIRPEIGLPDTVDEDDQQAHDLARANLENFEASGTLIHDNDPRLYVYRQHGCGHVQTGIVACVRVADYRDGIIKQHERTLVAKEQNRIRHFQATNAQTEPVFLMYRRSGGIDELVERALEQADPSYDFTSDDGVRHQLWPLSHEVSDAVVSAFTPVDFLYIADGHHRSASAVKVAGERGLDADDPRASIMAVIFPADDLKVLAYNRVVADLAGRSSADFIAALAAADFDVREVADADAAQPLSRAEFGVYTGGRWYAVRYVGALSGAVVADLDTSILTRTVLEPLLNIHDLRTDARISFIGGGAGTHALEEAAGSSGVAFSLFPTSVHDIMAVSDAGEIMPPKSTWFEPKLASGLFIHSLA